MSDSSVILHVAIFKPLRHCFDYLLPLDKVIDSKNLKPGIRLLVPFGRKQEVAVLLKVDQLSCIPTDKLKPITAFLDEEPILPSKILELYQWANRYYQHPIGEVILGTLPVLLRTVTQPKLQQRIYALTAEGKTIDSDALKRSPKQVALLALLKKYTSGIPVAQLKEAGFTMALVNTVSKKGLIAPTKIAFNNQALPVLPHSPQRIVEPSLELNAQQQMAVTAINAVDHFQVFLLEGVTGSGKTEVYLQLIDHCLKNGRQVLVLVPEIGLTPQTIARFEKRFSVPIAALHSKLSNTARRNAWLHAKQGNIQIVIGTRSAIFTPFARLGLIILDEEHDQSFKQQSGFRYSARDLAIVRGRLENIPVVLGTATPSLETLHNVTMQRFRRLTLPVRAGKAIAPSLKLIDLRAKHLEYGLSPELLVCMREHLQQNNQVLLFLNRRGYAAVLLCHTCGWTAQCLRCDARLTVHHRPMRLVCHHCTTEYPMNKICGGCGGSELFHVGLGTEQIEHGLRQHFPATEVIRIDKDTVRYKDALEKTLHTIQQGHKQILVGTQMLAKGHHFPNVTLVGIIDTDAGLFSTDFRATERMGQLILQVAGRAGRAEKPGQVLLQTHQPEHPLLQTLIHQGYAAFANILLEERKVGFWPPFSYLALLRAEANKEKNALHFLTTVRTIAEQLPQKGVQILGPIPAPMERKAGHFRALLLFQASDRNLLQRWLATLVTSLEKIIWQGKVRWSLDVDPQEMG